MSLFVRKGYEPTPEQIEAQRLLRKGFDALYPHKLTAFNAKLAQLSAQLLLNDDTLSQAARRQATLQKLACRGLESSQITVSGISSSSRLEKNAAEADTALKEAENAIADITKSTNEAVSGLRFGARLSRSVLGGYRPTLTSNTQLSNKRYAQVYTGEDDLVGTLVGLDPTLPAWDIDKLARLKMAPRDIARTPALIIRQDVPAGSSVIHDITFPMAVRQGVTWYDTYNLIGTPPPKVFMYGANVKPPTPPRLDLFKGDGSVLELIAQREQKRILMGLADEPPER